ncbi:MAG: 5-aminolevulinate synthase [Rickettsiaceae bacterium]|nr:5-aminolevulinate synthase [Rickettsiaceae bacterium]
MFDYNLAFRQQVSAIKDEKRYREFVGLQRALGKLPFATHNGKEIIVWCINDYLGMSQHPAVITAAQKSLIQNGLGSGGTRNIGGNSVAIVKLEETIAKLHNKESALVFTSGYVANEAALTAVAKVIPNIIYFSDELNHASIISGIGNSRAEKYIYKHLDMHDLEDKLKTVDYNHPKMIIFESTYSMNGLISPLKKICELAKKYNAMTYIDEVHSVGLYGKGGAGIADMYNLADEIDIIQGTLAKAYGTIGGYISGKNEIIDTVRSISRGFIFTTSLPPLIADAANASIMHLMASDEERDKHQYIVKLLKKSLKEAGIKFIENDTHIIPVIIGDPQLVYQVSKLLLEKYSIFIQYINFPTVPKNTERLRITPTPFHTEAMVQELVITLQKIFIELDIKQ